MAEASSLASRAAELLDRMIPEFSEEYLPRARAHALLATLIERESGPATRGAWRSVTSTWPSPSGRSDPPSPWGSAVSRSSSESPTSIRSVLSRSSKHYVST